jgi:hypothetical protein
MHREYTVQRQHERRVEERRKLDENLNRRITSKRKQQQQEGKFMRKLLRDSVNKSRAALWEEVSMTKMNNELNGTVSRSQSCLDVSSSSQIQIPDQLKNKVKQAKRYVLPSILVAIFANFFRDGTIYLINEFYLVFRVHVPKYGRHAHCLHSRLFPPLY